MKTNKKMLFINLINYLLKKEDLELHSLLVWFFPTYLKHCKQQASLDEEQLNEVDQFLWKQTECQND